MAERLQGCGVSTGVAVGRVLLMTPEAIPVVPAPVPPERIEDEIASFDEARERAREQITALRDRVEKVLGDRYAGILDAQRLILEDPRLIGETKQRIRVGRVAAAWALKEVVAGFRRAFESVDDDYLRERVGDLEDLHRRMQRLLGARETPRDLPAGPLVVVAHSIGPSDAVSLAQQHVIAVATDVGGPTSHTAILAQALGIPAVVGLHDVSERVRPGDSIVVDGDAGTVELLPGREALRGAAERQQAWRERESEMASASGLPSVTADGVEIVLRANIEFPSEVDAATRYGARGVGLYRSEFLFLSRSPELPSEEDHYRTYREIGEKATPHPVVIRTLDLGGEKYFHQVLDRNEPNPVMGLRAIRFCLKRPDIFRPQLRGLLRASVHADLRVMIPLVTSPAEIQAVRRMLAEEAEALRREGTAARADVQLGTMIEVPAAAVAADLLASEADFFSIGTNDLIQYALAVDRGNDSVSYLYEPLHPAVLRMLRFVIRAARDHGVPCALCGEMAADPALTAVLVGLGLRELSVQPRAIDPVRRAVRSLRADESETLVEHALAQGSAAEVAAYLQSASLIGREPR